VMPWLHLIFDAWEDYRKQRELEEAEREALEAQEREAMKVFEDADANGDESYHFGDDGNGDRKGKKEKKEKKKKKRKDKHKDRK
jgi:hypothetical protein